MEALRQLSYDETVVACLGQEHRLGSKDLHRLVSWGRTIGWKIIASAANDTEAGDTSGGTFVALRSYVNYSLWPGAVDDDGTLLAGRATGVIAHVFAKGGIGLMSVYLETGAGVKGNKEAMATLWHWKQKFPGPVLLGGDHNIIPQVLVDSGWPIAMGCEVVGSGLPTCGENEYVYFLVDSRIMDTVSPPERVALGMKPHWGASMRVEFGLSGLQAVQLVAPRAVPTTRLPGCERPFQFCGAHEA
jgi:hypothetical protein